jgi:hypothetical protein
MALHPEVTRTLDSLIFISRHKGFGGGDEKVQAVRRLQMLHREGLAPDPDEIEAYVLASGKSTEKGARQLADYMRGIAEGKRFRDYGRRYIL